MLFRTGDAINDIFHYQHILINKKGSMLLSPFLLSLTIVSLIVVTGHSSPFEDPSSSTPSTTATDKYHPLATDLNSYRRISLL